MMTDILRTKSNDKNSKSCYWQCKFLRDQNFTLKRCFVSRQVVCWLSLYNVSETSRKALPVAGLWEEINAFSFQWHVRIKYVITGFNWIYKHNCILPHFNHISSGMWSYLIFSANKTNCIRQEEKTTERPQAVRKSLACPACMAAAQSYTSLRQGTAVTLTQGAWTALLAAPPWFLSESFHPHSRQLSVLRLHRRSQIWRNLASGLKFVKGNGSDSKVGSESRKK